MTDETSPSGEAVERGVLPIVARSRAGVPGWLLAVAAGVAAILLFVVLDARRRAAEAPPVRPQAADMVDVPASIPTLQIPPEPAATAPASPAPGMLPSNVPLGSPLGPVPIVARQAPPPAYYSPGPLIPPPAMRTPQAAVSGGPAVVIDTSTTGGTPGTQPAAASATAANPGGLTSTTRVQASKLADKSTTVTQGTLIHAVLETGFDSTRPGFARAMVSRDVRGFDGTRVLIPRGSRVVGEYQSDTRPGQSRALIIWTRLIRPDGATIEIGSPASDPVGRGGVKADVNSHFFERFSGAILQSALDVGVNLASRSADRSLVVALPNSSLNAGQIVQPTAVVPTLKVKPATSISIFVARDLDFTEVENGQ